MKLSQFMTENYHKSLSECTKEEIYCGLLAMVKTMAKNKTHSGAQLILDECVAKGCKLYDLADYAVIQIKDGKKAALAKELEKK